MGACVRWRPRELSEYVPGASSVERLATLCAGCDGFGALGARTHTGRVDYAQLSICRKHLKRARRIAHVVCGCSRRCSRRVLSTSFLAKPDSIREARRAASHVRPAGVTHVLENMTTIIYTHVVHVVCRVCAVRINDALRTFTSHTACDVVCFQIYMRAAMFGGERHAATGA